MGNLMGSWRYKEPSTVEECDSTWESDSESDEQHQQQLGEEEEDSGISESISPSETGRGTEQLDHGSPQFVDMLESSTRMKRSFYAAKDLYKYRHSYPNYKEPRRTNEYRNLRFYLNKIPLVPDGIYIEEILTKWRGDYDKLEHNHTYIQWLFPLREQGLNFYAQELTQDEIKEFQSTREAKRRFLLAYTIMLDFFGIKLLDKNGNVARAQNWQDRFQHLNESQHNYLRITRILKSLGELGFEHFKLPLVRLLLEEALVEGTLPNMRHSTLEYFVYTLRQHSQRRALLRFAQRHYHPPENFIWGPPRRKRGPGTSGCAGTRAGKPEVTDRSAGKARSPKEGRNQSNLERETEDTDRSEEWIMAKGRIDTEEYIETIPL
ncbi:opioid growth factor receptor-like protein 1 [Triplophysa rosa]|uniref:Opioid growth factor receptor-like protein 1 n=1 Tax=Triplophysa rosa TaxID=992332 RepID=A0A9W7WNT1_TRIRA|nr:opioid growth factor receptor-like protein 1 [Triplophysa rosa]XP_057198604.1 opioid growth factor receptor-like protein 1 [Triplophysa rosa]KAI7805546.1 putative opioid growth factor receptor-like protein 1 [Triplophysa rosa]